MRLDFITLLAVAATNFFMLSVTLPLLMGRSASRAARCVQANVALQAITLACVMASSHLWDQMLSTVALAAYALAQWALFEALSDWLGPRPGKRLVQALVIAIPLGYTLGFGHYAFRGGWSNLLLAVLMLTVARATLYPARPARVRWRMLLMGCLVAIAAFTAARGILGILSGTAPVFRIPHPINIAAAVVANAALVLCVVALLVAWRAEAEHGLHMLAITDPLTGLLNRRGFELHVRALLAHAARHRLMMTAMILDLDHFKRVNDTHGHDGGDRALDLFARLIRDCARDSDVVCRWGGEEFGVLLTHQGTTAATRFDQRLRARLHQACLDELGFALDYSAGWAIAASDASQLSALMTQADAALYQAKAAGRGRLCGGNK